MKTLSLRFKKWWNDGGFNPEQFEALVADLIRLEARERDNKRELRNLTHCEHDEKLATCKDCK